MHKVERHMFCCRTIDSVGMNMSTVTQILCQSLKNLMKHVLMGDCTRMKQRWRPMLLISSLFSPGKHCSLWQKSSHILEESANSKYKNHDRNDILLSDAWAPHFHVHSWQETWRRAGRVKNIIIFTIHISLPLVRGGGPGIAVKRHLPTIQYQIWRNQ